MATVHRHPEGVTHPGAHRLLDMRAWAKQNPKRFEKWIEAMCAHLDRDYRKLCKRPA